MVVVLLRVIVVLVSLPFFDGRRKFSCQARNNQIPSVQPILSKGGAVVSKSAKQSERWNLCLDSSTSLVPELTLGRHSAISNKGEWARPRWSSECTLRVPVCVNRRGAAHV